MKPTDKRALAAAFRAVFIERMDDLGLSVDAMADACGLSPHTIRMYRSHARETVPGLDVFCDLARGLQLTERTLYARVRHERDALLYGRVM